MKPMQQHHKQADLRKHLRVFMRHKRLLILPFILSAVAATTLAFFLPKQYEATCLLVVERAKTVTTLLKDQVPPLKPEELIQALNERMLNWSALVGVVKKASLAPNISTEDVYGFEEAILKLKKRINLRIKGTDLIQVSYTGRYPELNAKIVDILVSDFLEKRLEEERQDAQQAYKFIDDELESYRKDLEDAEAKLRTFREKNTDALPGSENANYMAKIQTENRLMDVKEQTVENERRLANLRTQMEQIQKAAEAEQPKKTTSPTAMVLQEQITKLEVQLSGLRIRYQEKHPKVADTTEQLDVLRKKLEDEEQKLTAAETKAPSPLQLEISRQILETETELAALKSRRTMLEQRLAEYEEKVKNHPVREQELTKLQRDYEVKQELYNKRLYNLESARVTKELAIAAKTTRFTIVDPPRASYHPVKPSIPKIILAGAFIGLALGAGLVMLVEHMNQTFTDVDEAKEVLGIPLLGIVQNIETARAKDAKKRWRMAAGAAAAATCLAVSAVAAIKSLI